jgi:hypothetical protein
MLATAICCRLSLLTALAPVLITLASHSICHQRIELLLDQSSVIQVSKTRIWHLLPLLRLRAVTKVDRVVLHVVTLLLLLHVGDHGKSLA